MGNTKQNTQLRSVPGHNKVDETQARIREVYAEVARRAEYHTAGVITADELIKNCVHADAQLEQLFKQL